MNTDNAFITAIKPLNIPQMLLNWQHEDMGNCYDIIGTVAKIPSDDPDAEEPNSVELIMAIELHKSKLTCIITLEYYSQEHAGVTEKQSLYESGDTEAQAVAKFIEYCKVFDVPDTDAFAALPLFKELLSAAAAIEQSTASA